MPKWTIFSFGAHAFNAFPIYLFIYFLIFSQWTLVRSTEQPEYLVKLSYFSDQFRLITQTSSGSITKSRPRKGVNSTNQPQNIRAGCDYNPGLKNLQCLILGPRDVVLSPWVPKLNIANWKDWKKHQRDFRVAYFPVVTAVEDLCRKVEHWIQLSDSNTLQDFLFRL